MLRQQQLRRMPPLTNTYTFTATRHSFLFLPCSHPFNKANFLSICQMLWNLPYDGEDIRRYFPDRIELIVVVVVVELYTIVSIKSRVSFIMINRFSYHRYWKMLWILSMDSLLHIRTYRRYPCWSKLNKRICQLEITCSHLVELTSNRRRSSTV